MAYTNIDKPEDYFNTITWTGDGSRPVSITGVGFQPDMVWAKNRSPDAFEHKLYDSSRGAGSDKELTPNETYAEGGSNADTFGYLSSFDSDGFSSTDSNYNAYFNKSGTTYVAWNWKANGGTTASNTNGSITSTVQANQDAGFSIVTYTGTGSAATVGHGLGVAPSVVLVKSRNEVNYWVMYHHKSSSTPQNNYLLLDNTGAVGTLNNYWSSSAPSSTVFGLIGGGYSHNKSNINYVAYCFAEKQGYSKFGSYVGNGNADGAFIYTGFKPAVIILKRTDSARNWNIITGKTSENVIDLRLNPNDSAAEYTGTATDFLSNGFKLRNTNASANASGGTFIYMAFAESSFVTSGGIPTTAR